MITSTTKLLGIIGDPIEHSLSPVMHNAALTKLQLDYVYLPFRITSANLEVAIAGFATMGIMGFSVTIPHKQAIIPLLSEISPTAYTIGAVNTVIRQGDQWIGTNTDVEGFIAPLKTTYDRDWSQTKAVILGNGGAARAVVAGCIQLGMAEIHVVGRNIDKLRIFSQSWENSPFAGHFQWHEWDKLPQLLPDATLLVNTTPIGMYPKMNDSPLSKEEIGYLPDSAIAYDLIYIPKPTKFLHLAQTRNIIAIDGLEMLVQQGAAALKIWLQREDIPVDEMRQALQYHLGF
jgi:shikimate dehydrogenase